MTERNRVSLCGVAYELGRLSPIDEIQADGDTPETIRLLLQKGLQTYSKFDEPLSGIVQRCVLAALREAEFQPSDIDGVLVVTESFSEMVERPIARGDTPLWTARDGVFETFASLGIRNAAFFCSSFGGSSNFLQALFLAKPLVESGKIRNLLIVCVDRHPPSLSRFMSDAVALTGDGVAVCVLTHEVRAAAHEIEHVGIAPYLNGESRGNMARMMLEMYRATKSAAADCYEFTGRQPGDFQWLILSNYNEATSRIFAQLLGFRVDRTYLQNLSRTGHVPACDPLINFADLCAALQPNGTGSVMLYINGPISCGTVSLVAR